METRKTKLGVDHPSTLAITANLASTLWYQGRWEEAGQLFVQLVGISKTKLGTGHSGTLTSMANPAFTLESTGQHVEMMNLPALPSSNDFKVPLILTKCLMPTPCWNWKSGTWLPTHINVPFVYLVRKVLL